MLAAVMTYRFNYRIAYCVMRIALFEADYVGTCFEKGIVKKIDC